MKNIIPLFNTLYSYNTQIGIYIYLFLFFTLSNATPIAKPTLAPTAKLSNSEPKETPKHSPNPVYLYFYFS